MRKGNILPSLASDFSSLWAQTWELVWFTGLDRVQPRDASPVFSTLSLNSRGARRTRFYWLEYPQTKENLLEGQWEPAHAEYLLSARHWCDILKYLNHPNPAGKVFSATCNCWGQLQDTHLPRLTPRGIGFSVQRQAGAHTCSVAVGCCGHTHTKITCPK